MTVFTLFTVIFIINEIYYLFNREKLLKKFSDKDIDTYTKFDMIYYAINPVYWVWLIIGLFTSYSPFILAVISLPLIKFLIITFKSEIANKYYDITSAIIKIVILAAILYTYLSGLLLL